MQEQQARQQMLQQGLQKQLKVGAERRSPEAAASPLKTELQKTNQQTV